MRYEYEYVIITISKSTDTLRIELNEDGRNYLNTNFHDDNYSFYELLEDALCNGWHLFNGDQIDGWLTQCDVLSEDSYYDDNGDVILSGDIYTNINWYQIRSNIDMLLSGDCVFHKVS